MTAIPSLALTYTAVNPRKLSDRDLRRIGEVSQDMWASNEGLGEYIQCLSCGQVHSKEDIFGNTDRSRLQLCSELASSPMSCQKCNSPTRFMYGVRDNILAVTSREAASSYALIVLAKNSIGDIVWFEEGYQASLEKIFVHDFAYHYSRVGVADIQDRVSRVLGYSPKNLLSFSSIGFTPAYRNFPNLLSLLETFANNIPPQLIGTPAITELDQDAVLHKISIGLNQGFSLGYLSDPKMRPLIQNTGADYKSDVIVYKDGVSMYKDHFTQWMRHVLRLSREARLAENSSK